MIDKLYDQYEMICDICDDTGIPCNTFDECRHVMREQGWRTKKIDGEWIDMCPSCYAQYQADKRIYYRWRIRKDYKPIYQKITLWLKLSVN